MNRRSFFSRLASACAIIALAPRLAFKDEVELPGFDDGCMIEYQANTLGFRKQLIAAGAYAEQHGPPDDIDKIFEAVFQIKKERERK